MNSLNGGSTMPDYQKMYAILCRAIDAVIEREYPFSR